MQRQDAELAYVRGAQTRSAQSVENIASDQRHSKLAGRRWPERGFQMPRFQGKIMLVTGAATGIGRAVAVRFAREGASVAINHYRTPAEAEVTAEACRKAHSDGNFPGSRILSVAADISSEEQVATMFSEVIANLGGLDVLVNNAGILAGSPSDALPMDDFDRVLRVNLRGAVLCSRAAIRHYLEARKGGVILNNSSVHEVIPKPEFLAYSISKGALANLTRTLALEYADRGIRVNAVGPGAIETPLNAGWIDDAERRAMVESHIPMGRAGAPDEIAAVFAFLASDDASYITGQTIYACGGLTLYPEFRGTWASAE